MYVLIPDIDPNNNGSIILIQKQLKCNFIFIFSKYDWILKKQLVASVFFSLKERGNLFNFSLFLMLQHNYVSVTFLKLPIISVGIGLKNVVHLR